jgi:hypothetical protein
MSAKSVTKEMATATPVSTTTPSVAQPEWVLETSRHQWTFPTPPYNYPGKSGNPFPVNTWTSPPVDENHQLRSPSYTFDKLGGWPFSNFDDHRGDLRSPIIEITPDGRSVQITYKSWGDSFPVNIYADVYRRD